MVQPPLQPHAVVGTPETSAVVGLPVLALLLLPNLGVNGEHVNDECALPCSPPENK